MTEKATCKRQGCPKPSFCRGWCHMHYSRWQRDGDPGEAEPRRRADYEPVCSVDGCPDASQVKGMCMRHYERCQKEGDPGEAERRWHPLPQHCTESGCPKPAKALGLCGMHYWRVKMYGTTDPPPRQTPMERFLSHLETGPIFDGVPCQVWTGATERSGHVRVKVGGVKCSAHRWYWEQTVGPIPDGHQLHHRCENPPCVEPAHLVSVTRLQHEAEHRATHCKWGHEFTPENTYVDKNGSRHCRACAAIRKRGYRQTARHE